MVPLYFFFQSWPFEFHQNLQNGHNRNSHHTFGSVRMMDWQSSPGATYAKAPPPRSEPQTAIDASYTQLQDTHWYPAEMGMQLEQSRSVNGCCAYESGVPQHQRGVAIATSQAHSL